MKQLLSFTLPISLLSACSSGDGQYQKPEYQIDKSILDEVSKNTYNHDGVDYGSLEIRYYENDSLVSETFSSKAVLAFRIMQTHAKDGVFMRAIVGPTETWGFDLQIKKEKVVVSYSAGSDPAAFKKQQSDTALSGGIGLICKNRSLTLSKTPSFEDGEQIIGIATFETPEYWQVQNGVEKKVRLEGKAYFATTLSN